MQIPSGIQMVKSCQVCKWSGFRMASEYRTKKSGIRMARLRDYHYVANCNSYVLPFEIRTGFQMARPFENRTLKNPVFRWIRYSGVRYSDCYCKRFKKSSIYYRQISLLKNLYKISNCLELNLDFSNEIRSLK